MITDINKMCRFASIRDAMWAKFFNALGCEFKYHPVVHLGKSYMASFYLPTVNLIAFTDQNNKDAQAFVNLWSLDHVDVRCTWLGDIPKTEDDLCEFEVFGPERYDECYAFCVCPKCRQIGFEYMGRGERVCLKCCDGDKNYTHNAPEILDALEFARAGFSPYELKEFSEHHSAEQGHQWPF